MNVQLKTDTDKTTVGSQNKRQNITGQIIVDVTQVFVKRPMLLMDYDSQEVTFDPRHPENDGWVLDERCPTDDNCEPYPNMNNRKCIYKTQGEI